MAANLQRARPPSLPAGEAASLPRRGLIDRLNTEWRRPALWVFVAIVLLHWGEHVAQMWQIRVLGYSNTAAQWLIGVVFLIQAQIWHDWFRAQVPTSILQDYGSISRPELHLLYNAVVTIPDGGLRASRRELRKAWNCHPTRGNRRLCWLRTFRILREVEFQGARIRHVPTGGVAHPRRGRLRGGSPDSSHRLPLTLHLPLGRHPRRPGALPGDRRRVPGVSHTGKGHRCPTWAGNAGIRQGAAIPHGPRLGPVSRHHQADGRRSSIHPALLRPIERRRVLAEHHS
jgi:hypothetical protein